MALALLASVAGVLAQPKQVAALEPFGSFDVLERAPGGLRVAGWAMDPDTLTSSPVHVYIDGTGYAVTANLYRPDVGAAYGKGDYRGFDAVLPWSSTSTVNVCAYAINIAGSGSNQLIQCRSFSGTNNPIGTMDAVSQKPGTVFVQGWAMDQDIAGPIAVHVYVDSAFGSGTANIYRSDIASAYPAWGGNHAYAVEVPFTTAGSHTVCAYGINVAGGGNALLAPCQSFSVQVDPSGALVGAVTQEYTGLKISGWGVDPSTSSPIGIQIRRYTAPSYSSYTTIWTGTANQAAPTVPSQWAAWGSNHGFDVIIPGISGTGSDRFCAVLVNSGTGTDVRVPTGTISTSCPTASPGNIATLTMSSPSSGAEVWGPATLAATVSAGSVDAVAFYLDGGSSPVATDTSTPYSASWDTATTPDGAHTIVAKAFKNGLLVGESAPRSITVRNLVTVTLTGPVDGDATFGTLALTASVSAAASSVGSIEFLVDGNVVGTVTNGPYEFEWDSTTVSPGFHTFTVRAKRGSAVVGTSAAAVVDIWDCN